MKVGFSVVDITPEPGIYLTGYGMPERLATGVHSPLTATAMVLDDGDKNAVVISLDWCFVDWELIKDIRRAKHAKASMCGASACFAARKTETGVSRRGMDKNGVVNGFIADPDAIYDSNMTVVCFNIVFSRWKSAREITISIFLVESHFPFLFPFFLQPARYSFAGQGVFFTANPEWETFRPDDPLI